jgi:mono/diheme cytochrome c family protein
MRLSPFAVVVVALVTGACDVPTPMAPAEPIGEVPTWGEGFTVPTQMQGGSKMESGSHGTPTESGSKMPGALPEWGGGDVTLGKGVYTALCARCHGGDGEGGMVPGVGMATAFNDAGVQARLTDRDMARTIALGKGNMPAFMKDLDKDKLSGVIAYIRTLKK